MEVPRGSIRKKCSKKARSGKQHWRQVVGLYLLYLPLLDSLKAVANDDHVGQSMDRPVPPEQVVVQCLAAVHHVEQRRRSIYAVLALLGVVWSRCGHSSGTRGWDGVLTSFSGSRRSPSASSAASSSSEKAGSKRKQLLGGT